MDPSAAPEQAVVFGVVFFIIILFIILAMTILWIWVYCKIFSKTGYPWALGLLMLVPVANIVMLFVLAFGDWPVHQELRRLKQQLPQVH